MRISYRQGLISAQSNFLQIGQTDTRYVDISVSPIPVVATVASGNIDYLISEQRTVSNAWGPFNTTETAYLFWDMNVATGAVTRGHTNLSPVIGSAPPTPQLNQMWWDPTINTMNVFTGSRWAPALRVFAGTLQSGGILIPSPFVSQVGLAVVSDAGFVLTDSFGHAFKTSQGKFLTTDTPLSSSDTGSLVKLQGSQLIVQVNESMPKYSLVYITGGRASLASGDPALAGAKDPIAITTVDAYQNDAVTLVTGGQIVINDQWAFETPQIGLSVYCDDQGRVTPVKPLATTSIKVGTVVSANSILLSFGSATEIPANTGVTGVGVIAPIVKTGNEDYPVLSIPQASSVSDGFLSSADFVRIPIIEAILPTKSDVGHGHAIPEVVGLISALAEKANLIHAHEISDVNGLITVLNNKTDVGHVHVVANISDLPPVINQINYDISQKITKVPSSPGPIEYHFPALTPTGDLYDSGFSGLSFAFAVHIHEIAEINNLTDVLAGKSTVGHGHSIPEVSGLQTELNSKSPVGHGHSIASIADLQNQLDLRAPIVHVHRLDTHLTDVVITNPGNVDFLGYDLVTNKWINKLVRIQDVDQLEVSLLNKSDVNHTHIISGVEGLQLALDSKADINHVHDLPVHDHTISEIQNLSDSLNAKAEAVHVHAITDVDQLENSLQNKSNINHTHIISEVDGLQLALDSKADINHGHAMGDLTDVVATPPAPNNVLTYNGVAWEPRAPVGGGGGSGGSTNPKILFIMMGSNLFDSITDQWDILTTAPLGDADFAEYDSYTGTFKILSAVAHIYKITMHVNVTAIEPIEVTVDPWPVQSELYYLTSGISSYAGNVSFLGPASKRTPLRRADVEGYQELGIDYEHSFFLAVPNIDVENSEPLSEFFVQQRAAFAVPGYSLDTHSQFKVVLEIEQMPEFLVNI